MNDDRANRLKEMDNMLEDFGDFDGEYSIELKDSDTRLIVTPNAKDWEGATKWGSPFYIQINDIDYSSDAFIGLTLEQTVSLRDFLDKKIKFIKDNG